MAVLDLQSLRVSFPSAHGLVEAVRDVSLTVNEGEVLALVGESGCGKSALCKALMGLLPASARVSAERVLVAGHDVTGLGERELRPLRGSTLSMVLQDPLASLDPTMPVGDQVAEAVRALPGNRRMPKAAVRERVHELMELVGIDRVRDRMGLLPRSLSGGMRQRVVLAMALAGSPRLLLADEPTTALDVTIQAEVLDLLAAARERGTSTLLVTHDLGAVARVADRVAVMYAGKVVEVGRADEVFHDPRHPYTWGLLGSLPTRACGADELPTIQGMPPSLVGLPKGDAFAPRNPYALAIDYEREPPFFDVSPTHRAATWLLDPRAPKVVRPELAAAAPRRRRELGEPLLRVSHLTHDFALAHGARLRAVDDVSFELRRGEILGLVGESGSGKSTVAHAVMGLLSPAAGSIVYRGVEVTDRRARRAERRMLQTSRQLVFQDSASSLDNRISVCDVVAEPLRINHVTTPRGSAREEAAFQLRAVGLDQSLLDKHPAELSGGQRQRVALARALTMEPDLLVADEPLASLDVSVQAQVANLFKHLQAEHGFSFLFIAHDLSMVEFLCDRVGVMWQGRLVELAPTDELFSRPEHPYTRSLVSSVPVPDPNVERRRVVVRPELGTWDNAAGMREVRAGHWVLGAPMGT